MAPLISMSSCIENLDLCLVVGTLLHDLLDYVVLVFIVHRSVMLYHFFGFEYDASIRHALFMPKIQKTI